MQKNELKSLVEEMYNNLLDSIDEQDEVNKDHVANYLIEAAGVIAGVNESVVDSIELAKATFVNSYKEIAKESLSSYESTNSRFEVLTQLHEETMNEAAQHIDLPQITNKFNEIQGHMTEEVKKANDIISQLTKQVKTLEEKSNIDSLTKVYNRRALSSYLFDICSVDKMTDELHVLILDIDDFKLINDNFGHLAGDKILIFIANILKKTLRDGDKIFRFGGEEFVIVLNRIDADKCKAITSRLLTLVSDNKLLYKNESISVTISIGATKFIKNDTPDSLISRADKALYKAKRNGKNQMYIEVN